MQDEIIEFIKNVVGEDRANVFQNLFSICDKLQVENYILPFDEIYSLSEDIEVTEAISKMEVEASSLLDIVLRNYGIFTSDYLALNTGIVILDSIESVYKEDELASNILDICNTEDPDEIKLSNILSQVSLIDSEELSTIIERVNPALIRNIKNVLETEVTIDTPKPTDPIKVKQITKLYSSSNVSCIYFRLLEGLKFELPFKTYTDIIWPELANQDVKVIAKDLVGMCIVSNDKCNSVLESIREFLKANVADIDLNSKLLNLTSSIFLDINNNSGITKL